MLGLTPYTPEFYVLHGPTLTRVLSLPSGNISKHGAYTPENLSKIALGFVKQLLDEAL